MPAVIVDWKGKCPSRAVQEELLSYLQVLAQRNDARWEALLSSRLLPRCAYDDADDVPPRFENIRAFEQHLSGHILISSAVALAPENWKVESDRLGLGREQVSQASSHFLIRLNDLRVYGMDFRLFDPEEITNDDYRVSLFFLQSEAAPFLNGHLVEFQGRERCISSKHELIRQADWYIEFPGIYIHYAMESFLLGLLRWIKYFFIPDLHYWYYEALWGYDEVRPKYDDLVALLGSEGAKRSSFNAMENLFEREADRAIELRCS